MQTNRERSLPQLTESGDGLWEMAVPYRVMGIELGRRMTVVRLPEERLWIHAPVAPSPELKAALTALAPVSYIIGPNILHDGYLLEFTRDYPQAEFHAAPGLAEANRSLRPTHILGRVSASAWAEVLDQHLVDGMPKLNELVFLHRPSRSLIIADLAFNVRAPKPWLTRTLMRLNGDAYDRFTPTRVFKSLIQDRAALRASIDRILAWDFERIVVGHGENVVVDAKNALRNAYAFLR